MDAHQQAAGPTVGERGRRARRMHARRLGAGLSTATVLALLVLGPAQAASVDDGSVASAIAASQQRALASGITFATGETTVQRNAAGTVVRGFEEDGALDYVGVLGSDGLWRKYTVPSQYFRDEFAIAARAMGLSPRALITDGPLSRDEEQEFADPWAWWASNPGDEYDVDAEGRLLRVRSAGQTVFEVLDYSAPKARMPSPQELITTTQSDRVIAIGLEGRRLVDRLMRLSAVFENNPRSTRDPIGVLRTVLTNAGFRVRPVAQGARVSQSFPSGAVWTATIDVVPTPRFRVRLAVSGVRGP